MGPWLIVAALDLPLCALAHAQQISRTEVQLDIPAQPLADALVAFSAATGLQVFYDGALALGRRSSAVSGTLMPDEGLRRLLAGTGYAAVATADPETITIAAALVPARPTASASSAHLRKYAPYFGSIQTRVGEVLCANATVQSGEIIVSFRLAASGVVSSAELLAGPERSRALVHELQGLSIGEPLPAGLPQPITMAIFPPAPGETSDCAASSRARK